MPKSVSGIAAFLVATTIACSIVNGSVIGLGAALAAAPEATNLDIATQTVSARGVTIKVTPKNLGNDAASWEFAIVLDSHSQDLIDDSMKSALLFDGKGAQFSPSGWDGAPSGGHHREGVLNFKPISPRPQAIELQITRIGDDAPRSFRWQLK